MNDCTVSVVIVNYRSGPALKRCLEALLSNDQGLAFEVIVVDNASGDDSLEEARRWGDTDSRLRSIESQTNRGLAGGVNIALAEADGQYLAIINPDTLPEPGWLVPLVEAMTADPSVGVACPLVLVTGTTTINSAGQHIHVTGLGFNHLLGEPMSTTGQETREVSGLHGAAFMIGRDFLRELGGWDETGFLYQEDVALSWITRLAGKRIVCVSASRVSHDYFLTMYPDKLYLLERNRHGLLITHLHPSTRLALAPLLAVSEAMVWLLCLIRGRTFVDAKKRANRWIKDEPAAIVEWQARVARVRTVGDWALLRAMGWTYPIRQMLVLSREKGSSTRQPPGGLPVPRSGQMPHRGDTTDVEYARRLIRHQQVWWRRLFDVQRPYRRNLERLQMGRVLDLGCGIGRHLVNFDPGSVGVDHNSTAVATCQAMGLKAYLPEEFMAAHDPARDTFDSVLGAHLVEHMTYQEGVDLLREYLSFLRPGGRLVLICPQEAGFRSDATHVEFMDETALKRMMADLGLSHERTYSFPLPRAIGRFFRHNEIVAVGTLPA